MNTTAIVYGIANCTTVKKTRAWLEEHAIPHHFHDYKKAGLDEETLDLWIAEMGWETLLNRRGTTWRRLPLEQRDAIDAASARGLMLENHSIIKRPVIDYAGKRLCGFDPALYAELFATRD